jgi:hypothetical protein
MLQLSLAPQSELCNTRAQRFGMVNPRRSREFVSRHLLRLHNKAPLAHDHLLLFLTHHTTTPIAKLKAVCRKNMFFLSQTKVDKRTQTQRFPNFFRHQPDTRHCTPSARRTVRTCDTCAHTADKAHSCEDEEQKKRQTFVTCKSTTSLDVNSSITSLATHTPVHAEKGGTEEGAESELSKSDALEQCATSYWREEAC